MITGRPPCASRIELEDHLSRHDAKNTLRIATAWGRYTEVFSYDDKTGMLSAIQS
jgi:NitT/TauT family transport system ATP-binding protein